MVISNVFWVLISVVIVYGLFSLCVIVLVVYLNWQTWKKLDRVVSFMKGEREILSGQVTSLITEVGYLKGRLGETNERPPSHDR